MRSKKWSKNGSHPKLLLSAVFGFSGVARTILIDFGSQNGSQEGPGATFSRASPALGFQLDFSSFCSVKKVKNLKMKKCVSICELHTILEVAPSKKNRCLREKALSIQARHSVKNRVKIGPDSDSERQRHQKPTKIACDAVSERTFSAPGAIFGDLGPPDGSQKS